MKSITLKAPAKINLYLDVINKRRDGYHNIKTIFQKINLCDKIKVTIIKKGISLHCRYPGVPEKRANLAYQAAELMKREFGLGAGIAIDITKKIPPAAGLGGGSSDAACVITAVNRLFGLKAAAKRLMMTASKIGADVPFFVSGYNCALGTGIGDKLKEIRPSFLSYILLLIPKLTIYTKTIYRKVSLPLTKPGGSVKMLTHILSSGGLNPSCLSDNKEPGSIKGLLYNRLEDIVLPAYPIVKEAKAVLSSYNPAGTLLSGSGPACFAIFKSRKEAIRARDKIKRDGRWQLFLTRTARHCEER